MQSLGHRGMTETQIGDTITKSLSPQLFAMSKCLFKPAWLEFEHSNKTWTSKVARIFLWKNILYSEAPCFWSIGQSAQVLSCSFPNLIFFRHQELMMQSPTTWEIWAKGQRTSKGKESDPKQIETIIHDSDMMENHQKNVPGKWATSF